MNGISKITVVSPIFEARTGHWEGGRGQSPSLSLTLHPPVIINNTPLRVFQMVFSYLITPVPDCSVLLWGSSLIH